MPSYMFKINGEYLTVEASDFERALEGARGLEIRLGKYNTEYTIGNEDPTVSSVASEALFCKR